MDFVLSLPCDRHGFSMFLPVAAEAVICVTPDRRDYGDGPVPTGAYGEGRKPAA